MAGVIGSYFTNYSKTITHQAEIFQGKLSTIVIFIPCKFIVNLGKLLFFGLTNVVMGLKSNSKGGKHTHGCKNCLVHFRKKLKPSSHSLIYDCYFVMEGQFIHWEL